MTIHSSILAVIEDIEHRFTSADLFYGHGTDNALDEAVFIVFTLLGLDYDCPASELERPITDKDQTRIEQLVQERIGSRKPAAYLLNKAWFCGLSFYVNENVLVPRSPIAELIEQQFSPWIKADKVTRILDMGTGSGCIAIACAYAFPEAIIDAVELDERALTVAEKNIQQHGLTDRVRAIRSDLFSNIVEQKYDLIISNPPYVSEEELAELPMEYQHEPIHALHADDDGLAIVKTLLQQAKKHLNDNGILITEVGYSQDPLIETYPDAPFFWFEFERGGEGVFMLDKEQLTTFVV